MTESKVIRLFRPVGEREMHLIRASNFSSFPPRLAEQPIFYPVLEREYAETIARDWNTRDQASGNVGYVLQFDVLVEFLGKFEPHTVGSSLHREYWIPAERLSEFNEAIVGKIKVIIEFR